ncbi:uncharacterized protein [Takifugu rubripes]|uniref:uncharacterized protein n=1 Tax=Takifugu rubripes TaxID=31033 RepID=UPI001145D276|nr:uncharacterized protein LOC115247963 [Takifugu rubripes]
MSDCGEMSHTMSDSQGKELYPATMYKCFLQQTKYMKGLDLEKYFPDKLLFIQSTSHLIKHRAASDLTNPEIFRHKKHEDPTQYCKLQRCKKSWPDSLRAMSVHKRGDDVPDHLQLELIEVTRSARRQADGSTLSDPDCASGAHSGCGRSRPNGLRGHGLYIRHTLCSGSRGCAATVEEQVQRKGEASSHGLRPGDRTRWRRSLSGDQAGCPSQGSGWSSP